MGAGREDLKKRLSLGVVRRGLAKTDIGLKLGDVSDIEIAFARQLAVELAKVVEGLSRGGGIKPSQEPQTVIHNQYHNQHSRNVYPDARATRAATINGESDKERRKTG